VSKICRVLAVGILALVGTITLPDCDTDTHLVQEIASLRLEPTAAVLSVAGSDSTGHSDDEEMG
jgi:hypothetical protein